MVMSSKSHPKKNYDELCFSQKKKIPFDITNRSFSDFETEPKTPFGNRNFFFFQIQLPLIVF